MSTVQEIEIQVLPVPDRAKALKIQTNEQFVEAGELLKTIKGLRAEIDETFNPIISKAHEAHREALAQKRKVEAPLAEAEAILKPRISGYLEEQERLRREEELRRQKEEQDKAEAQQVADAILLHDIGETALANQVIDEKPYVAPVVLPRSVPKVAGITSTKRYSAEVIDLKALVMAVATGKAPIQCLQADQVFLNRQAVAMKDALSYPGVRVKIEAGISARR